VTEKKRAIWRDLEEAFGGSKFRILLYLGLHPENAYTRYALVKATGLRTPTVGKHLSLLVKMGWVREYPFSPKTYQINTGNEIVKCFLEFLERIKRHKAD